MEMVVLPSLRHFSRMAAPFQTHKRKTKQHIKKEGKEAKQDKTRTDGSQSLGEPLENNTGRSRGHGGAVGYGKKLATGGGGPLEDRTFRARKPGVNSCLPKHPCTSPWTPNLRPNPNPRSPSPGKPKMTLPQKDQRNKEENQWEKRLGQTCLWVSGKGGGDMRRHPWAPCWPGTLCSSGLSLRT